MFFFSCFLFTDNEDTARFAHQRPHDAVRKDRGPLLDRPLHAVVLNRYVVDLLLYFVGTDVFDIVDFDATKSLSCLHAIFEHKERANPLHP